MGGSSALGATLCLVLILASSVGANDELKKISTSSSAFGQRLFQQFESQGNVVISPMSAYLGLAMARLGAKGQTRQEISKGLGFENTEDNEKGFSDMLTAFSSAKDARVVVANRIFVQEKLTLDPKFNEGSQKVFKASAQNIDFEAPTAADVINNWIKNATRNRILDIADQSSLEKGTKLMLVNVLYFRGPWEYRFYLPSDPRPFYLDESKTVDAHFMSQEDYYGYASLQDLDAELIEIPYKEKDYSFVIILPKKTNGLSDLEKKVAARSLPDLFSSVKSEEITLHMPKFQLEMTTKLNKPLKQIGFGSMFSDGADFTGLTNEKLKISEVLQKTYFEIHENGTEAAAATAFRAVPASAKLQEHIIKCDHPFLFYLMHKRSLVLFAGKFVDPRVEKVHV